MNEPADNPTAHEVATAIVAAARLYREDPIMAATGGFATPARWMAFAALLEVFPFTEFRNIAKFCGFQGTRLTIGNLRSQLAYSRRHKKWRWWRDSDLADVRKAVAAAREATEAALASWSPAAAPLDGEIIEPPPPPIVEASRVKKWAAGECDAPAVERPSIILPPSNAVAKINKAPAIVAALDAEAVEAPPSRRADPVVKRMARAPTVAAPVLVPNGVSPAARALADFQRAKTKPKLPAVAVEKRATFDMNPGVSRTRPDLPIEQRPVVSLTADLCGDPAPGRSALAQRKPAPPLRRAPAHDGPTSLEDFVRQGRH